MGDVRRYPTGLAALLLSLCLGCAQSRWTFAPPDPSSQRLAFVSNGANENNVVEEHRDAPLPANSTVVPESPRATANAEPHRASGTLEGSRAETLEAAADQREFHLPSIEERLGGFVDRVKQDYRNFYARDSLLGLGLGLGGAAILAETRLDQHFRNWYQDDVRSPGTDRTAKFFKTFGEGGIVIPAALGLAVAGNLLDEFPLADAVGEYGQRVTRAYLVGAPPLLFFQSALGADRPGTGPNASQWRPFQSSHGVSGHAFMGSVPFITAAEMVDNPLLKGTLYFGSTLTAWSRINDDKHYLSQAILGWWMGYLAAHSVSKTDDAHKSFSMQPLLTPEATGVSFTYQY